MNEEKRQYIKQLCNEDGVIGALAIDHKIQWQRIRRIRNR
jgi:tagatose-1,6-bisphosphate aldolase